MTRAALTKLIILVILAFIICLPEFFSFYRVSKVNFRCVPYRPCGQGDQMKTEENLSMEEEDWKSSMCDPLETSGSEQWQQSCIQQNQNQNTTYPVSKSWKGVEDLQMSCFICETDLNITEFNKNNSSAAQNIRLEMSMDVQLWDAEPLNLTLYGHYNKNSLHLHPSEEEEQRKKDDEGHKDAFFYCPPLLPTLQSTNHSRCLLWLANQTVWTAKEKLPWKRILKAADEWGCVFRVLWLVLLCVVLLTVAATVLRQIYQGKHHCRKPWIKPVNYNPHGQRINDAEEYSEPATPKVMNLNTSRTRTWSGAVLSPIEEVDSSGDAETLLDGNVETCYIANLHHRCHPSCSSSSVTEEQTW